MVREDLEDGWIKEKIGTRDDSLDESCQLSIGVSQTVWKALTHDASPLINDLQAMSTADRLLEHAVLTWMLGPFRSKYQLMRFGMMQETVPPVTAVRSTLSGSIAANLEKSSSMEAAKTAVREPLSFSTGIPAMNTWSVSTPS